MYYPQAQEEMAWRVAEMIVKDITSITMGTSQSDEELQLVIKVQLHHFFQSSQQKSTVYMKFCQDCNSLQ